MRERVEGESEVGGGRERVVAGESGRERSRRTQRGRAGGGRSEERGFEDGQMLACRTLGKGLRLRAVLLDVAVLERSPHEPKLRRQESAWGLDSPRCPEQLIAQRKVKLLLLSEIRAELFKRGAPIIGKRWELEARLEKLYAAEPDSMLTPAGERETAGETAASLREKYAAKLRAKTGGSIGPSAGSRQPAQDMRVASEIAAASAGWLSLIHI